MCCTGWLFHWQMPLCCLPMEEAASTIPGWDTVLMTRGLRVYMLHESITKVNVANLLVHDGTVGQPTFEFAHATHVGLSEDWRCVQFVCAKECEVAQHKGYI